MKSIILTLLIFGLLVSCKTDIKEPDHEKAELVILNLDDKTNFCFSNYLSGKKFYLFSPYYQKAEIEKNNKVDLSSLDFNFVPEECFLVLSTTMESNKKEVMLLPRSVIDFSLVKDSLFFQKRDCFYFVDDKNVVHESKRVLSH